MTEILPEIVLGAVAVGIGLKWWQVKKKQDRQDFLTAFRFPVGLYTRLQKSYPQLTDKEYHLVAQALRHYFMAYVFSGFKFVGMPSRIADDLWHLFILDTKAYADFCKQAFGKFFHHVPATSYTREQSNEFLALRRTWRACCKIEGIHPNYPTRLPLLFAIDKKLGIPGAVEYSLARPEDSDSGAGSGTDGSDTYYVGDFGGSNDSGSSGSDSGDSGGSDGGCGGGCGGGD